LLFSVLLVFGKSKDKKVGKCAPVVVITI